MPNSVQYEAQAAAQSLGSGYATRSSDINGKVRCLRFDIQFAGEASGTAFNLGIIPAGAVFLFANICTEGTTNLTIKIGDSSDDDRLCTNVDLTSATPDANSLGLIYQRLDSTAFDTSGPGGGTGGPVSVGVGYRFTADTVIIATTGGATNDSGEVLRGAIFYCIE